MIIWLMSIPPACRLHEPIAVSNRYSLLNAYCVLGIIQAVAPLIFTIALEVAIDPHFSNKET